MSDERLKRPLGADRQSRAMQDRAVTENRETSDSIRLADKRLKLQENSILPNAPTKDGWHFLWATTTNQSDTIPYRLSLGYQFATREDVPGLELNSVKSAEDADKIQVNEMVLLKIREEDYRDYMRINHVLKPAEEEARLNAARDAILENAREAGAKILEGEQAEF